MKERVGIIGSRSMVGSQVCEELADDAGIELIKADIRDDIKIDITDKESVVTFFRDHAFGWVVLFSAFTDVNGAEEQRDDKKGLCYQINVEGSANIANACRAYNRKLIFISTDFVFDGANGPYNEGDPTGPDLNKVGWYGITKIIAEKNIQQILPESDVIILRIAYPYSGVDTGKDDLALGIIKLFDQGKLYPMYTDQIITPTFIPDISQAIKLLISRNQHGVFHLASPTATTQFEFASQLLKVVRGQKIELETAKLEDALSKSDIIPRPLKGGLKVNKIQKLGMNPTNWQEGISQVSKNLD